MTPTPQQQEVIDSSAPRICVIAGAGAGKTATLKQRVLTRALPAREVVLVTFTNAGANEMRKRLGDYKPRFVGTLHRFCFLLIQQFGNLIGYRNGTVAIVDEEQRNAILDEVVADLGMKKRLSKTALMKRLGPDAEMVWKELAFRLKQDNTVDYDGILENGLTLIRHAKVKEAWQITDLILDEIQDSGDTDWSIILNFPTKNIFVVGDPDQSIFGFRGGKPSLLQRFHSLADTTPFVIEDNFRSDQQICAVANKLIEHNTGRIPKRLRPVSAFDGAVTVDAHETDHAEIRWLIGKLERESNPNEVAVLSRLNRITNEARQACRQAGIPVNEPPKKFNQDEWSKVLALVGLILDRGSNLLAEKFLRFSKPATDVARMKLTALAGSRKLLDVAGLKFPEKIELKDVPQILAQKGVGMEEVAVVTSRIALNESIAELLHDLWGRADWEENSSKGFGVTFATIHGSKGREFDAVFILGMEEGVLPMLKDSAPLDEERRLAFVGFTRARHTLALSWARKRSQEFGLPRYAERSRFIEEAL